MQIPIVQGIYTDIDFRSFYPRNMIPIPKQSGISAGYLRQAEGLVEFGEGDATDRGGIEWNNVLYRVIGSKLVKITSDGLISIIGDVGNNGKEVSFTYSFDRLAIASNGDLFYLQGSTLTQVTDPDLGVALDVVWVDGYFMTTDGEYLVVTELSDPTSVDPLKYGSSEADPDPIKALLKIRNEVYALNRYTIEIFDNVGGSDFPFARVESAQIEKGVVGTHACSEYLGGIAFVGGGKNESIAIWLGGNATANKLSTKEIDRLIAEEYNVENIVLETRIDKTHQLLYVHLSNKTLVYDAIASNALQIPIWFILDTNGSQYKAKNFIWCYDKWIFGDPTSNKIGYLDESVNTHFGEENEWEFSTGIIYNESRGAILHQIELVGLKNGLTEGVIYTDYSLDGENYTTPTSVSIGKRMVWFQQGMMQDQRIQRFRGTSNISIARLEVQIEGLNV